MGWSVMSDPWYTKPRLVDYLVSDEWWKGASCKPVRHSVVGNHLWILLDRVSGEGSPQEVALYELSGPRPGDEPSGWGYKDLPCREHLDAPAYFLEASLCPDYYGKWLEQMEQDRREARELTQRLQALKPGEVLGWAGRRFELIARVRGGWTVREVTEGASSTSVYKMTLAQARESLRDGAKPPEAPQTPPEASQGALL